MTRLTNYLEILLKREQLVWKTLFITLLIIYTILTCTIYADIVKIVNVYSSSKIRLINMSLSKISVKNITTEITFIIKTLPNFRTLIIRLRENVFPLYIVFPSIYYVHRIIPSVSAIQLVVREEKINVHRVKSIYYLITKTLSNEKVSEHIIVTRKISLNIAPALNQTYIIVSCYSSSIVKEFNIHLINFEYHRVLECDFNLDGRLDVGDVVLLLRILVGTYHSNIPCDLNHNGKLDIGDAILLLEKLVSG